MWPRPADLTGPLALGDVPRRIREGVPGTAMPAFADLDAADQARLIADVRSLGAVEPPAVAVPTPPPNLAALRGGEAIWRSAGCAGCHDQRPALLDNTGQPADLYDLRTAPLKGGPQPADLFVAITRGRPGTPMPGRSDLSVADRWALVAWLLQRRGTVDSHPRLPPKAARPSAREVLWAQIPTSALETPLPIMQSRRADQCGRCHPHTFEQWGASRHAQATGPGLTGQYIGRGRGFSAQCDRCHAPQATDPGDAAHADGISCVGCHVRAHGKLTKHATQPPGLALKPTPRLGRSDFCMPCHNLPLRSAVNGRPLIDTWREWAASPYLPAGVQCQHCHLGEGDHRMVGAHDADAVRRAVQVEADAPRLVDGRIEVTVRVRNIGAGHHFPTTATPRAVLRIRQRHGAERLDATARLWAIGRTVEHAEGRWREIADTRIPAGATLTRTYRVAHAPGADAVEVDLHMFPDWFYTRAFRAWLTRDDLPAAARAAYSKALADGDARVIRAHWSVLPLP